MNERTHGERTASDSWSQIRGPLQLGWNCTTTIRRSSLLFHENGGRVFFPIFVAPLSLFSRDREIFSNS